MTTAKRSALFTLPILLLLISVVSVAAAPAPTVVPGNPTCQALGFTYGFKIEPVASGVYGPEGDRVRLWVSGSNLDWRAGFQVGAVIVKGGPVANVYYYSPTTNQDWGLQPAINPNNGKPYGFSHVDFCYDPRPCPCSY